MAKLKITNRYGVIPNDLLNSEKVSFKAKGLYAYIQSKPDGWDFSAERISYQVKEGLPSIRSALKELELSGYLHRRKYQNQLGHFEIEYILFENPQLENPIAENLYIGNPMSENPYLGKTINNSNIDLSKKEHLNKSNNKKIKKDLIERKNEFLLLLSNYEHTLGDQFDSFFSYWTETDKNQNMRFEKEKFFDISRRIGTWMSRSYQKPVNKAKQNFEQISTIVDNLIQQEKDGKFINPFTIGGK